MNENRTTRVVAVMAANGFVVSKLAEHWIPEGRPLLMRTIVFILLALVGVSLAYFSLFVGRSRERFPRLRLVTGHVGV
jgi:hypothetical protein